MSTPILSILIPVFNKFAFTKSCLSDLSHLPEDHQIIVFDNGSSDETQKELEKWNKHPNFKYIRSNENLGFAKAINQMYVQADAPNVLLLNNDIRVKENHKNWTQPLLEYCEKFIVGPTMGELDNNFNFVREANIQLTSKNSYMSGWCLASSKKILDKLKQGDYIGPMSEEFGLAYFEDTDLGLRAKQINIPFKVVNVPVVHFGRISSKQLNTNLLYSRAKAIFIKKWQNK